MKLAIHIRHLSQHRAGADILTHLRSYYDEGDIDPQVYGHISNRVDRLYIGDEFCPIRLPDPTALKKYCQYSKENNIGLTLLTPVLTDAWLDHCRSLFDTLERWDPHAEIVVNDLGTLFFLKKHHSRFSIAMGRLFNKGFKDPRLSVENRTLTKDMSGLLEESTFDNPQFPKLLARLAVTRVERDLMPHGRRIFTNGKAHATAYYFPFGYVTTGRVCRTSTFAQQGKKEFRPLDNCSKPCDKLSYQLESEHAAMTLIQAGNTIFYLYSPETLNRLLSQAGQSEHRLIYQGFFL